MKKVLLSAVAAVALTTATQAASPFSGFYLGGGIAYNSSKATNKATVTTPALTGTLWNKSGSASNASFLAYLGYGHMFGGGMYLGGEFNLGYDTSANFGNTQNQALGLLPANSLTISNRAKGGFSSEISARLGYVFCNKTLVYGKLGYAWHPKTTLQLKNNATGAVIASETFKRDGFILGAGVEHAMTNNWLIRGEYKYNFGRKNTRSDTNGALNFRDEVKTSGHTLMLGVAYKF